jgi:ABC-type nickel/cobalt efflux system permease component RcnA
VTIVIGVGLVGLGIALLAGRQLTLAIPKLQRGGSDGTLASMFLFGISYAIASLSCTIGPFLAVTTATFRSQNWLAGLAVFVTYALGMGLVVAILTVAVALTKAGIVQRFRSLLPKMNRIAGGLLVLAGAYVAYYGWYETRVFNGDTDDPIVDRATQLQGWLQRAVVPDHPRAFAVGAATTLAAGATAARWLRSRRARHAAERRPEQQPVAAHDMDAAAPTP